MKKPSVTIIGAGSLGGSLAVALRKAGYRIEEVVYRRDRKRAVDIARRCAGLVVTLDQARFDAMVVWLCVGDSEIPRVTESLADHSWKGKIVFHASGALASDELRLVKRKGAAVASVHPMMSFVRSAAASFGGVTFALEGDAAAKKVATKMARDLGGTSFELKKPDKPLYHALGAFSSPLLIAHLAAAEKIGKRLGLRPEKTRQVIGPILQKTLQNYLEHGAPAALSGPLVRGDVETLRKNLQALNQVPGTAEIFRALVRIAITELPVRQKSAIASLVQE